MHPVAALIDHVADVEAAQDWYLQVFDAARLLRQESSKLAVLDIGGFYLDLKWYCLNYLRLWNEFVICKESVFYVWVLFEVCMIRFGI